MDRREFDGWIEELREAAEDRLAHATYLEDLIDAEEAEGEPPNPEGRRGLTWKAAVALESDVSTLYRTLRHPEKLINYGREYPRMRAKARLAASRGQATRSADPLGSLLRLDAANPE